MTINDDRTPEQVATHRFAVVGTDPFMSGWGGAADGVSYAAWAYRDGEMSGCESWVRQRGDMKRVRVVCLDDYRPKGRGNLHVYVWKNSRELRGEA